MLDNVELKELAEAAGKQVVKELETDAECGLSEDEVQRRLGYYGENAIQEEHPNPILQFLKKFWGPIPGMIEVAIVLSAIIQRWEELIVISILLLVNVGVGYWHESTASRAIEALKKGLAPRARVVRDGKHQTIEARDLVPGDIALLRMGDITPADTKLLDGHVDADESSLTGESLPVSKEENNNCFAGTTISDGEARGVVIATGHRTRFARTIELVAGAQERSHFQQAVIRIGYFLISSAIVLVVAILIVSLFRGVAWPDVVIFILGLTVASIPVALPAVLSITMSVGAARLAREKAIVSRLAAMEEIAGLEVLCADKTGTLTKNEIQVEDPVLLTAKDEHDLMLTAALTCRREESDPIDKAILARLNDTSELDTYKIDEFRPFDPTRKMADADVSRDGNKFTVAKGAPQAIMALVEDKIVDDKVEKKVDELGEEGFRALGVARKDDGKWLYLGILPLLDPPRDDSASIIKSAQEHGIDIRMVTGDHFAIARQVAKRLGLGQNIKIGPELFEESKEEKERKGQAEQVSEETISADGFAEVTPEHKFNIIKWFQANDRIVGMTGDGINDAPALKQADVGIAVTGASDAARSAADLVLTAPGLGVIIHAVEEARRIFERMVSYATYRITETVRLMLFISVSIFVFNFYPVTPIMIVLLAILNDIPIIAIAWDNVPTPGKPVRWDMRAVLSTAALLGIGGVIASFLLYWFLRTQLNLSPDLIQSLMFLKLLVAGHLTIFLTRNEGWLWQKPYPSLLLFVTLESTQIIGTFIAVYGLFIHPIGWAWAGILWGYALGWMFLLNIVKVLIFRTMGRSTVGQLK